MASEGLAQDSQLCAPTAQQALPIYEAQVFDQRHRLLEYAADATINVNWAHGDKDKGRAIGKREWGSQSFVRTFNRDTSVRYAFKTAYQGDSSMTIKGAIIGTFIEKDIESSHPSLARIKMIISENYLITPKFSEPRWDGSQLIYEYDVRALPGPNGKIMEGKVIRGSLSLDAEKCVPVKVSGRVQVGSGENGNRWVKIMHGTQYFSTTPENLVLLTHGELELELKPVFIFSPGGQVKIDVQFENHRSIKWLAQPSIYQNGLAR